MHLRAILTRAEKKSALFYQKAANAHYRALKIAREPLVEVNESATALTLKVKMVVTMLVANVLVGAMSCSAVGKPSQASLGNKLGHYSVYMVILSLNLMKNSMISQVN